MKQSGVARGHWQGARSLGSQARVCQQPENPGEETPRAIPDACDTQGASPNLDGTSCLLTPAHPPQGLCGAQSRGVPSLQFP